MRRTEGAVLSKKGQSRGKLGSEKREGLPPLKPPTRAAHPCRPSFRLLKKPDNFLASARMSSASAAADAVVNGNSQDAWGPRRLSASTIVFTTCDVT